jgi:hypothetical protein
LLILRELYVERIRDYVCHIFQHCVQLEVVLSFNVFVSDTVSKLQSNQLEDLKVPHDRIWVSGHPENLKEKLDSFESLILIIFFLIWQQLKQWVLKAMVVGDICVNKLA